MHILAIPAPGPRQRRGSANIKLNKSVSTSIGTRLEPGSKTAVLPGQDGNDGVRVQRLQ